MNPKVKPMLAAKEKWRKENPEAHRTMVVANLPKDCRGKKNGNWKGGVTAKNRGIRWSYEYKLWRKEVLERDGNKCKVCGSTKNLQVHHIIAMSECPEITLLPMNGVTLCTDHHYEHDDAWKGKRFVHGPSFGKNLILCFSVPHRFQAYETCGNWQFTKDGTIVIFVSAEMSETSQQLVVLHELAEVMMCRAKGITQKSVDQFDMEYEKNRVEGDESEPGDHPHAPYQEQHNIATGIERIVCAAMGIAWKDHDQEVMKL